MNIYAGIDGFPGGWVRVTIDSAGRVEVNLFPDEVLMPALKDMDLVLIDIPIGLPYKPEHRTCDRIARTRLKWPRASGIFSPPCREALTARSYHEAKEINERILGRKLTLQAYYIGKKIRITDRILQENRNLRDRVRESHPEVCFQALAGGRSMAFPKRTPEGFRERINVLETIWPLAGKAVRETFTRFPGSGVARDDIVDALVLAVSAGYFGDRLIRIPEQPEYDLQGLPMQITLPKTNAVK
jgi:predicted RNase H-like nuclease